ncbi:hypothetical protein THAOC_16163 [Thalassiosira oceanica]|uniref:RING-type domain-containing protein n=1 Tax=Thalassiosira oceanica TaxID=159749 RepID=K0SYE3_THAOC|nr:hypothetical protein THAOC_16163 [Thalassiosira oceanica]|eukprot:EJK63192.1 hypothetical protein THAOC_16163 [Thalassiosira oceanica]
MYADSAISSGGAHVQEIAAIRAKVSMGNGAHGARDLEFAESCFRTSTKEPAASLRAALSDIVGFAHVTRYRLAVEGIDGGTRDGFVSNDVPANGAGKGSGGGGNGQSRRGRRKKSNGSQSSKDDHLFDHLGVVSPYTGRGAAIEPALSRGPDHVLTGRDADGNKLAPGEGTNGAAKTDGAEAKAGRTDLLTLDEYSDLASLEALLRSDPSSADTIDGTSYGIRVVLERYDVASAASGLCCHLRAVLSEEEVAEARAAARAKGDGEGGRRGEEGGGGDQRGQPPRPAESKAAAPPKSGDEAMKEKGAEELLRVKKEKEAEEAKKREDEARRRSEISAQLPAIPADYDLSHTEVRDGDLRAYYHLVCGEEGLSAPKPKNGAGSGSGSLGNPIPREIEDVLAEIGTALDAALTLSEYNPPPSHRRAAGDLAYVRAVMPNGLCLHVTATPLGFYVSSSTGERYGPRPVVGNGDSSLAPEGGGRGALRGRDTCPARYHQESLGAQTGQVPNSIPSGVLGPMTAASDPLALGPLRGELRSKIRQDVRLARALLSSSKRDPGDGTPATPPRRVSRRALASPYDTYVATYASGGSIQKGRNGGRAIQKGRDDPVTVPVTVPLEKTVATNHHRRVPKGERAYRFHAVTTASNHHRSMAAQIEMDGTDANTVDVVTETTCAICLEDPKDPLNLPCGHSFCDGCLNEWRSRYGVKEEMRRKCPICRATIPPSKEMVSSLISYRALKKKFEDKGDTSSEVYRSACLILVQVENEVGADWDGVTVLEDDRQPAVVMPDYIHNAALRGDIKSVLKWINANRTEDRVNATTSVEHLNVPILFLATRSNQLTLMTLLLQLGADADSRTSKCITAIGILFSDATFERGDVSLRARLLLSWGVSFIHDGDERKRCLSKARKWGYHKLAELLESELGGRRCEIVNLPSQPEINGKTCVADEYLPDSNQYKVTLETKSKDVLVLSPDNLKRRDRTPQDCGYYVEFKNGRTIRHDFDSNEDCQAFVAALNNNGETQPAVTEEAEAAAEQAAAELLAELGLGDSSTAPSSGCKAKKSKKKKGSPQAALKVPLDSTRRCPRRAECFQQQTDELGRRTRPDVLVRDGRVAPTSIADHEVLVREGRTAPTTIAVVGTDSSRRRKATTTVSLAYSAADADPAAAAYAHSETEARGQTTTTKAASTGGTGGGPPSSPCPPHQRDIDKRVGRQLFVAGIAPNSVKNYVTRHHVAVGSLIKTKLVGSANAKAVALSPPMPGK